MELYIYIYLIKVAEKGEKPGSRKGHSTTLSISAFIYNTHYIIHYIYLNKDLLLFSKRKKWKWISFVLYYTIYFPSFRLTVDQVVICLSIAHLLYPISVPEHAGTYMYGFSSGCLTITVTARLIFLNSRHSFTHNTFLYIKKGKRKKHHSCSV